MATITTSMVLLRWPLLSAVLMFLASTLNIQFRKSDYAGLALISTLLGLGAACWFATGLLGITLVDIAAVWENIKVVMVEAMSHTPPDWPMVIT
ncbi:YjcB family protein [Enterobacter hormaechei]|uniref:YjcB family protein n=1 Tax=Enterobacter hormaechei TaxID=158836 RepID=UPI00214D1FE7|nr:YjcB family protein [Enterobacter hormaechei]MCR4023454.1 YjcB family protein [Enterobacter hormaechei]MCR4028640.1 YjcB family protein [Enterobacter hormaechei]